MATKWNTETIVIRFKEIHGEDKYNYDEVDYINTTKKVKIYCNTCEEYYFQTPKKHLLGQGCKECSRIKLSKTTEEFIKDAKAIHGEDRYDYSVTKYINKHENVDIKCNRCKNIFNQSPNNHLKGKGCPVCNKGGFDMNKPGILYYLRVDDYEINHLGDKVILDTFYKIGITNKTVEERFKESNDLTKIKLIDYISFDKGIDAYRIEQKIIKKFEEWKVKNNHGHDVLDKAGNSEIFIYDILEITKGGRNRYKRMEEVVEIVISE